MRTRSAVKADVSDSPRDRPWHPIVLAGTGAVEKAWTGRPGQQSRKWRTSAVAMLVDKATDKTSVGSCQAHAVPPLSGRPSRARQEASQARLFVSEPGGSAPGDARGGFAPEGAREREFGISSSPSSSSANAANTRIGNYQAGCFISAGSRAPFSFSFLFFFVPSGPLSRPALKIFVAERKAAG